MPKLYKEDQARVDQVLATGVYGVDRKPFKPWRLLLILLVVLGVITAASYLIALRHGMI